jgi:hypothetical protein
MKIKRKQMKNEEKKRKAVTVFKINNLQMYK